MIPIKAFLVIFIQRGVEIMVFNSTFNNVSVILWQSVLLVEESGVPLRKPLTQHKCKCCVVVYLPTNFEKDWPT
jgi:hypothetical protein